jgi:hypothetical protein
MRAWGRLVAESVLNHFSHQPEKAPNSVPLLGTSSAGCDLLHRHCLSQAVAYRDVKHGLDKFNTALPDVAPAEDATFRATSAMVPLPLEDWTASQIREHADRCLADSAGSNEFHESFALAIETWRKTMIDRQTRREPPFTPAEIFVVRLGGMTFVAVNAEIFSRFTELVRNNGNHAIYTVGCAGGMIGYVPTMAAYEEGAYEVEWSMLFYNRPRPRRGGLELLAERARKLVAELR